MCAWIWQRTTRRKRNMIPDNTLSLARKLCALLKPPPDITLSKWADGYRRLSTEGSAEPGQWRTSRAPYQKGIMDAISDRETERVVIMSCSQIGKTDAAILNPIGYYMDYDPAPIMVVQPTIAMGETFSKERLAPMLRDTPALQGKVGSVRSRTGENTILEKSFPGGYIVIAGANSAASLASRPVRVLLFDEVDRAPESAGTEGDPVELAMVRTTTFWQRKIVLTSTPTIKGSSRIEQLYQDSTQEQWCLPCPSCGEKQPLEWPRLNFETLELACRECGCLHSRQEWLSREGEWIARQAEHKVRGFHLNALVSPWSKWGDLVDEWRKAAQLAERGDPEKLKVFINTKLGETWEDRGEKVDGHSLLSRREPYYAQIPDGVCVLTLGVDVQDDRLAYEVVGHGLDGESWGIEYGELWGDPRQSRSDVWTQLDSVWAKRRCYGSGQSLSICAACVDSGGHAVDAVYAYCKARENRRIWAIKGEGGEGKPFTEKWRRTKRNRNLLFILGVNAGKDAIMAKLRVQRPGPGYCHFPRAEDGGALQGYGEHYFEGLTSEKKTAVRGRNGFVKYEWVKNPGARNEPLDCRNYANAALEIYKPNLPAIHQSEPWNTSPPPKPVKKQRRRNKSLSQKTF